MLWSLWQHGNLHWQWLRTGYTLRNHHALSYHHIFIPPCAPPLHPPSPAEEFSPARQHTCLYRTALEELAVKGIVTNVRRKRLKTVGWNILLDQHHDLNLLNVRQKNYFTMPSATWSICCPVHNWFEKWLQFLWNELLLRGAKIK